MVVSPLITKNTSSSSVPELSLDDISVAYRAFPILRHVSGCFSAGSLTALVGPNGGGKSTLLKAIMGILPLKEGQIHPANRHQKSVFAYLPQMTTVDRHFPLTVQDVVASGLCLKKGFFRAFGKEGHDQVAHALETVGMSDYKDALLRSLSGGQFQRVLFARLSLQNASIVLLDEPFAAVDRHTTEELVGVVTRWHQQGKTIIAVLHNDALVHQYFPETLLLARTVVAWGKTKDVLSEENHQRAQEQASLWMEAHSQRETPYV